MVLALEIIGWIAWAIVTYLAITFVIGMRMAVARGDNFNWATCVQTIFWWIIAATFLFIPASKLHILWLVPVLFFISMFIVFSRIPIISPVVMFLTNIFMKLMLIGVKRPSEKDADKPRMNKEEFRRKVLDFEDEMFGITLYYDTMMYHLAMTPKGMLEQQKDDLDADIKAFKDIMDRNTPFLDKMKKALQAMDETEQEIDIIDNYPFPPTTKDMSPPLMKEFNEKLGLLLETYNEIFPDRPKTKLSQNELIIFVNALTDNL